MPCSLLDLYRTLTDPCVAQVHIELPLAGLAELHAELLRIWLYCVAQHHGADVLVPAMLTRDASAAACALFVKLGVRCHVDEPGPSDDADPLAAFTSVSVSSAGRHTLAFSLGHAAAGSCRAAL
jgi:hypothetical protein